MYYKIQLRILGHYYSDGFIKFEGSTFEGYLTEDYIIGYFSEDRYSNNKLLNITVECAECYEDSIIEFECEFLSQEFYVPSAYVTSMLLEVEDEMTGKLLERDVQVEISFIEKLTKQQIPDFEKILDEIKENLEL